MDVLQDALIGDKRGYAVLVECIAKFIYVRSDAAQTVNAVNEAVTFDEFGATSQHGWH